MKYFKFFIALTVISLILVMLNSEEENAIYNECGMMGGPLYPNTVVPVSEICEKDQVIQVEKGTIIIENLEATLPLRLNFSSEHSDEQWKVEFPRMMIDDMEFESLTDMRFEKSDTGG